MPSRVFMSSGDMVADRRFDYGRDLQSRGDLAAAADLFTQATELVPGFASAWFALGDLSERRGDPLGATAAFLRAKAADPCDFHGAGVRLMRLNGDPVAAMPPGYVTALYNQYAPKFENSLVGDLRYRGPDLLFAAVQATCAAQGRPGTFHRTIDLGCGTGLAARAFAGHTDEMIGIDLSPGMLQQARATGLYSELEVADAIAGLMHRPDVSADLCLAADMMIYLHDLAPLIDQVGRVLRSGGLFAFTAETHDGNGVVLGVGLRYAQSEVYLRGVLSNAGFIIARVDYASIRNEREMAVPSLVMVAGKP